MGEVVETTVWRNNLERTNGALAPQGPAAPFVTAMHHAKTRHERLFLATRALRRDPDCIEANLVVAENCHDLELRLLYLNIAVEAGEALWGAPGVRCALGGPIGTSPHARPWLQALKALGEVLETAGDPESAHEYYARLLQVDPDDKLDVRAKLDELSRNTAPTPCM